MKSWKLISIILAGVAIFVTTSFNNFFFNTRVCRLAADDRLVLATAKTGLFHDYIPLNGKLDSVSCGISVDIDQMYYERVCIGLIATSEFGGRIYELRITRKDTIIENGRFKVSMIFVAGFPSTLDKRTNVRLRLTLREPFYTLLIPAGNFYRETRGEWIFVVKNNKATRQVIKIGRRSGDYGLEVLAGLQDGDTVITSSYDRLENEKSVDLAGLAVRW